MSETSPVNRCPTCGAAMPANAPEGLCPKCLLLGAAAPTESGAGQAPPAAPTLDAVAAAFPQLEILEFIGQGGMGCVFKARQPQLSRFVALKILPEALAQDAAFAARFAREAQALAALSHPNIVTVHDSGRSGGFFYLLMEYVDGANLRQALRAGRFTPEQALAIVPPICDALQFAHEHGIVHRDIKPENVLLDKAGRVKIADFGIAKMVGANANTRPSDTLSPAGGEGRGDGDPATEYTASGTPQYMAPEQRTDSQRADHRADIYSLGVVFYEMLTGELPTQRLDPPSSRVRGIQIDVRLDEVVLRALEKSPELRWQTAAELRTQVETIATSAAAPAAPAGAEPTGRRYAAGIVGLAVFALVMIGVTIFTFSTTQSYIATAKILVKDGAATELATGVERIRSFDLLRKVATHLDLERRWARKFGSGGASVDKAVELLRRQTHSRFSRNARIVEVRFTSESRQEAAEIANKIADVYRSSPEGAGAEILQSAEPPLRRAKPNVPFNLAVGALAAIVLGSMAAGVMSIAARRVRHAGDGGPDKTRDMSAIPGISRRKNLVGVLLLCTPPTLSAWFVLIGYRVFGVDLDADTQFWTGLIGFPMSAGFGTLLAWLAGAFRGINEVAPTNGPRCWPARAIAATVLLLVSVLLMGGGMVMLALVTQERDWNPSSDEALFVLTIAGGGLLALAATTLVGWSARKQIQREPLRLRGWGGAFAAAWFWPGVATGLLALSLPVLIFADRDGVPPHLTTVSQKAELVAREAATNSARDAAQTSPRKVVDQWLESVKADRTDEMWNLTTRESGGAGSVDLKNTWEFDKIKAYSLAADDALAMVVSTGYKDNAGQERVIVFSLIKRDGRWLIRENAVTTPEGAESRIEGFTAHPGVKHDVRREDIIGRWTEAFFSPAIYSFSADGNFSMSFRVVGGSRTNLQGLWRLEDDRLTYRTGAGSTTGRVVRMREDFFQLKFPDGNLNSFHRMDGATGARP
ncbi:MAG TPA: protein kinase, partial [Verrucomicrobiae bacterium]|nr:protein kinase [Verrucomicrobiae bacterium]